LHCHFMNIVEEKSRLKLTNLLIRFKLVNVV
jgi:hypothetical protein